MFLKSEDSNIASEGRPKPVTTTLEFSNVVRLSPVYLCTYMVDFRFIVTMNCKVNKFS